LARALSCALLALPAGCYRTAIVPLADVPAGATVDLDLSGAAVERLRAAPATARLLDGFATSGRIVRRERDSVLVSVALRTQQPNARPVTTWQSLLLGVDEVRRVQVRTLDRRKTRWVAIGTGAAVVLGSTLIVYRGGQSSGANGRPIDGPENRIPLVARVRLP
jgi:hypothetical protein